jgi:3-dehydroquinate dehydratase-1
MNRVVKVKDVVIGEGMPKICIPMTGETNSQLFEEAHLMKNMDFDIIEWRADFYEGVSSIDKVINVLKEIRKILAEKPVIFTLRSLKEGGNREISTDFYFKLNKAVVEAKLIEVIDVELFNDENSVKELVKTAHENGTSVIISNHDFYKTPLKEEIISRLKRAFELGGDIAKMAVMSNSSEDVITLMDATRIMKEQYVAGPIITMSMGGKGVISRLAGEVFGSSLTFGAAKKASAPGQISAADLRRAIEIIHDNL